MRPLHTLVASLSSCLSCSAGDLRPPPRCCWPVECLLNSGSLYSWTMSTFAVTSGFTVRALIGQAQSTRVKQPIPPLPPCSHHLHTRLDRRELALMWDSVLAVNQSPSLFARPVPLCAQRAALAKLAHSMLGVNQRRRTLLDLILMMSATPRQKRCWKQDLKAPC